MDERVGIAVLGVSGRMGRMLAAAVQETPEARISGATVRAGHPWVGRDLGAALGGPDLGVRVTDDPIEAFAMSQAALDFTTPAATMLHAELAAQARLTHVVGTTGLEREQLERLAAAARHAVIVRAGNMSVGVNLLTVLARRVGGDAGAGVRHRDRRDASPPQGRRALGHRADAGRGGGGGAAGQPRRRRPNAAATASPAPGPKAPIGFASLRGGDVVGEHELIFAGPGERVVLRHVATDRMLFARGAVRAALWGQDREPGLYDMIDVLGLRDPAAEVPDR